MIFTKNETGNGNFKFNVLNIPLAANTVTLIVNKENVGPPDFTNFH
jgi:hypothetical protein